jgi:hypothetical protein
MQQCNATVCMGKRFEKTKCGQVLLFADLITMGQRIRFFTQAKICTKRQENSNF